MTTNRAPAKTPEKPFTAAQRERLFNNAGPDVKMYLTLAEFHRVVQYVEEAHNITKEKMDDNT